MFAVIRAIHFCYGHRLVGYEGKCRHLHGHNGLVEIELRADRLDAQGMVVDFEEVKRTVQAWIDAELDHKMILSRQDPLVPVLAERKEPMVLLDANPTAEAIAKLIYDHAKERGLPVASVRLWETPGNSAVYLG